MTIGCVCTFIICIFFSCCSCSNEMGFRGNRGVNPLSCSTTLKACTDQKRRKADPMKDTELVICCCVFICCLHKFTKIMLVFVHDTCSLSFCVTVFDDLGHFRNCWTIHLITVWLRLVQYVRPNLVQRQCKFKGLQGVNLRHWQDVTKSQIECFITSFH